jgi:hypothetical protein
MNDVSSEHEWQPHLVEAEQTPPGPTKVGSRRRYVSRFLGKELTNTYIVTIWEPDHRLVCESTQDSVLQVVSEVRWAEADGGTRVTMALEGSPTGPFKFVPRAMLESTFESEVNTALTHLKERLEASD